MDKIKLTYKQWQLLGWQVSYGERSRSRNGKGEATFNGTQVFQL